MTTENAVVEVGFSRHEIAKNIALDIPDNTYVNVGIGIPTLVPAYVDQRRDVIFHTENGLLGMGPAPSPEAADPNIINAGKQLATAVPGSAFMNHADSFALIRGGHLDLAVLGAFEVSVRGDLANWATDGTATPGVGGAMDIAVGARVVWVAMRHLTSDGRSKLVRQCTYPLTAERVVTRIYTDLAVLERDERSEVWSVRRIAAGVSFAELVAATEFEIQH
jgi:3-oxoadipate CoA-transferase, beta subunit